MTMVTSFEAGQLFGCSATMARELLGEPDQIYIMDNKKVRFYYESSRVTGAVERYRARVAAKKLELGLRSCRTCGKKFQQKELTTGKCPACRAEYLCYNFLCHGDSFEHAPDYDRIAIIRQALDRIEARLKEKSVLQEKIS